MAGKYFSAPAEAVAAGCISELRRIVDRGGGGGGEWSAGAEGFGVVAMGSVQCGRDRTSGVRKDSDHSKLVGTGRAGAVRQRIYGEGGDAAPWSVGAVHREFGGLGSVDAEHRHRAGREFSEPLLYGSVEGVVRGDYVYAAV